MMKLYRTPSGPIVEHQGAYYEVPAGSWDGLLNSDDLHGHLQKRVAGGHYRVEFSPDKAKLLPPIGTQEVWAAGVTYFRSRDARMSESQQAGGGSFYDKVYTAARPELFFKATPHRVVGPGAAVRIRRDSKWNVPEPELTLVINARGKIIGYTIGNDMSSRDIEGENPLYLPQAKVYDACCALGPAILVADGPLPGATPITLKISRAGNPGTPEFEGKTTLAELKREPAELVEYLYMESSFPTGCFLLTGTGIIPPNDFTLQPGDRIEIGIEPIGTLVNTVEQKS